MCWQALSPPLSRRLEQVAKAAAGDAASEKFLQRLKSKLRAKVVKE